MTALFSKSSLKLSEGGLSPTRGAFGRVCSSLQLLSNDSTLKKWNRLATVLLLGAGATSAYELLVTRTSGGFVISLLFTAGAALLTATTFLRPLAIPEVARLYEFRERDLIAKITQRGSKTRVEDLEIEIFRSIEGIVSRTSRILSSQAEDECSVSVKLLWSLPGAQEPVVHTVLRDRRFRAHRSTAPDDFPFEENTAFVSIICNPDTGGYFVEDDLTTAAQDGRYTNSNELWPTLYNSTAVIAIGKLHNDHLRIAGFLCVDSWYGRLSNEKVRKVLEYVSDYIYTSLQMIVLLGSHKPFVKEDLQLQSAPTIGWLLRDGKLEFDKVSQSVLQEAVTTLQAAYDVVMDVNTLGAGAAPVNTRGQLASPHMRRSAMNAEIGTSPRPGSALPTITPQELAEAQSQRRKDPKYVEKLLEEAQSEFDQKWGIDPTTPTDYDSRI